MNKRPNILIVMTDHQRADTVLPEHPCRTPHLDAFAKQGVIFTDAYCPTPHCCPSRATFMTGLYPSRHSVWNNVCNGQALSTGLRPGVRCWSEDLKAAGYDLHYAGKWHVSVTESPRDRGWQERHVSGTKIQDPAEAWQPWRNWSGEQDTARNGNGEICRPGWGTYRTYGVREEGNPHDEQVVRDAVDVLSGAIRPDAPWCLFAGLTGPHDPYFVPSRVLDLYRPEDVPLPPSYGDRMQDKPGLYRRMREQIWDQLSEREAREAIRHFWAYCTYLDDQFGRILQALEATGQADNTLVIYTSDHGDYCGDHGLFAKSIPCFDGAYRVPSVLRWPRGIRNPGRRVGEFASLADIAPTLLEAAEIESQQTFTGQSLVPFLENRTPADWRDAMFTQCNGVEVYATQRSVRTRTHKLVYNAFDQDELYDLTQDPHEMRNVAELPPYREIRHDLMRRLWRFAEAQADTAHNNYITIAMAPWGPGDAFQTTRKENA